MIKNCPVCGKAFDVLWPELWRYIRKNRYLCSWKCIRLYDKEKKEEEQMKKDNEPIKRLRMSKDDMAEAVRLWRKNDPGLDQYLKDHGINHISKWKQNAKIRYREKPADYGQPILGFGPWDEEPADTVKVEPPEEQTEVKASEINLAIASEDLFAEEEKEFDNRCTVTAIRVEGLGEFYYDQKFKSIDWRAPGGDEVSLGPAWWIQLAEDLPMILKKLVVEL